MRISSIPLLVCYTIAALIATASNAASAQTGRPGELNFRQFTIVDEQQGGLIYATMPVPEGWKTTSHVRWNYADLSQPVRIDIRVESPDGSAWLEFFPMEVFFWFEGARLSAGVPVGGRSLGMIHAPGIQIQQAMQQYAIGQHRGKYDQLQVVSAGPIDAASVANAYKMQGMPGQAMSARLRYRLNGRAAEEDMIGYLADGNRVASHSPVGTTYERHRPLVLLHAFGATEGLLQSVYPLLTYIATAGRVDPIWTAHRDKVVAAMAADFNRRMAQGYAQIAAAGATSKAISANNDAMLQSLQARRQAQNQRDAIARSNSSSSDGFSQYIRGTQRVRDAYGNVSEISSTDRYHWTDGFGNYRSTNDSTVNPNVGGAPGSTWQRMESVR